MVLLFSLGQSILVGVHELLQRNAVLNRRGFDED